MKEIKLIKNLAKDIKQRYAFTSDTFEAFLEDTSYVEQLEEELEKIKSNLMNYEEYKQTYLDSLIDELDALVYKKKKRKKKCKHAKK